MQDFAKTIQALEKNKPRQSGQEYLILAFNEIANGYKEEMKILRPYDQSTSMLVDVAFHMEKRANGIAAILLLPRPVEK